MSSAIKQEYGFVRITLTSRPTQPEPDVNKKKYLDIIMPILPTPPTEKEWEEIEHNNQLNEGNDLPEFGTPV